MNRGLTPWNKRKQRKRRRLEKIRRIGFNAFRAVVDHVMEIISNCLLSFGMFWKC